MSLFGDITGAVGLVGSIFNSGAERRVARENTEKTIKAQKELAEYSYNKDVEMWNRANEYNSPTAQMSRLSDAGLNPNLVYGSGTVAGNTSTQTPKYQMYNSEYKNVPFRLDLPGVLSVLGMYQDLQIKKSQTDSIQADVRRKEIENFYLSPTSASKLDSLQMDTKLKKALTNQDWFNESGDFSMDALRKSPAFTKFIMDIDRTESEIGRTQASTRLTNEDVMLRKFENKMAEQGLTKSDNFLLRMFLQGGGIEWLNKLWGNTSPKK